jgi:hypothetical protein
MHRFTLRRLVSPAALFLSTLIGCGDDPEVQPPECEDGCFTAPAPTCRGDQAVTSAVPGTCLEGICSYAENVSTCAFGCGNGECLPDPCANVVCNRAPSPWCEGDVAVTSARVGVCDDGTCDYRLSRFDCGSVGQFCSNGLCVSSDPCEGVFCQTPPPPVCGADGDSVISFSPGECEEGECSFRQSTTPCSEEGETCVNGECAPDPRCAGVVCNAPPNPWCSDNRAYTHADLGVCDRGRCNYEQTETRCSLDGATCFDGECVPAACASGDCRAVPEDTCEGNFALRYADEGVCTLDGCVFPRNRIDCAASGRRCSNGDCVDPCAGVACDTPPDDVCEGAVAVRYSVGGVCTAGSCAYSETRFDCAAIGRACDDGACVSACTGVDCFVAPAPTCLDEFTFRAFSLPGACVDGTCEFNTFDVACSLNERCIEGECTPSVDCVDAEDCDGPPPFCDGTVAVQRIGASACDAGLCAFDESETRTNCAELGQSCVQGACVDADPCEDVTCNVVPAPRCIGSVLISVDEPGTCDGGECRFSETSFDCGANGQLCVDGACVDVTPCLFTDCSVALTPGPYCDGNTAMVPLGPGTCDESTGLCTVDAPGTRTLCTGQVCIAGSCQPVVPEGSLVVTEFYVSANRFDRVRTWVEVANIGSVPVALSSLRLRSSTGAQATVISTEAVAPGERAIIAAARGDLPAPPNGLWGDTTPLFAAFGDSITLLYGSVVMDIIPYGTTEEIWPFALGNSIVLTGDISTVDNSVSSAWCLSANVYNVITGSRGTPGQESSDCLP